MIGNVRSEDADIYNYYIENTSITFEIRNVSEEDEEERIRKITDKNYPFIVYEEQRKLAGYAYLSDWRDREAYKNTLEISIYIDKDYQGRGIGKK